MCLRGTEKKMKEIALAAIMGLYGTPYKWGGNDPMDGLDCSALVNIYLKIRGILEEKEDLSSKMLWERFEKSKIRFPKRGCLVFYTNSAGNVNHVDIYLGKNMVIGAIGGRRSTLSLASAKLHQAFVKVEHINHNRMLKGFLNP